MQKDAVKVILVMGKSGSGKQPRIDCLSEEFGFFQISTGTLFRDRIGLFNSVEYQDSVLNIWDDVTNGFKSDDEIIKLFANNSKHSERIIPTKRASIILGAKAKYYVEAGLFCPDSLTNDIFKHAFEYYLNTPLETCGSRNRGVILDGFPRTKNQLEFLVELLSSHSLKIDFVLEVDLDDETIVKRTTGRRICPSCQGVFHLMFIPPRDGKFCTKCEGDVVVKQRTDDSTEALLRKRLSEFQEKVVPVLDLIREVYRIPFVTVCGNLPDPSRTAVRRDVMSNVNALFGIVEEIDGTPTPTPNMAQCMPYLMLNGVTAPLRTPRLLHLPSSSNLSTLLCNPPSGSSPFASLPSPCSPMGGASPSFTRSPSFTSSSPTVSLSPSSSSSPVVSLSPSSPASAGYFSAHTPVTAAVNAAALSHNSIPAFFPSSMSMPKSLTAGSSVALADRAEEETIS